VTLYPPDWRFNLDELSTAFNVKTKAIIINTPHNPTGKVFSRDELRDIANLCIKWDTYCITDEVYEHIIYDAAEHISIASLDGMTDRTVTINSMSKTYSVTGWRVGWAIANKHVTSGIRKVHDFLTVGAARPFQEAGVTALNMPPSYYQGLQQTYEKARKILYEVLIKTGFKCEKPKGAYYMMCENENLRELLDANNDHEFARRLIEKTGVASVPGSSFYSNPDKGTKQLRFCFSKSDSTLNQVKTAFNKLSGITS
jgi:aminotransferase